MDFRKLLSNINGLTGQPIYRPGSGQIDTGVSEILQNIVRPRSAYADNGGSNLVPGNNTLGGAVRVVQPLLGGYISETTNKANEQSKTGIQGGNQGNGGAEIPQGIDLGGGPGRVVGGNNGGVSNSGTQNTNNGDNGMQDLYMRQLNSARDEARRRAGEGFERARGIFDEGMGLLGKRRGEFENLFNQGKDSILDRYEQNRGELQTSDQGNRTRLMNTMRAAGMGGSALFEGRGTQNQNAARALGGLQTERNTNENANLGEFNTRQNWADTQEGALQRSLNDASEARNRAESSSDLGYLSDVGNLFNTLLSNQMATKAAAGEYQANPYSVNMSSMVDKLNGTLPMLSGENSGANGVQAVSVQDQNPTLAAQFKKQRSGVAGGTLYNQKPRG